MLDARPGERRRVAPSPLHVVLGRDLEKIDGEAAAPFALERGRLRDEVVEKLPPQTEAYAPDTAHKIFFFESPEQVPAPQLASPPPMAGFFFAAVVTGLAAAAGVATVAGAAGAGAAAAATGAALDVGAAGAAGAAAGAADGAAAAAVSAFAPQLFAEHEAAPVAGADAAGFTSVAFTGWGSAPPQARAVVALMAARMVTKWSMERLGLMDRFS
jgi:hypothetical protein